jgi:hypothetical protein
VKPLTARDRRALLLLAAAVALCAAIWFWPASVASPDASTDNVPQAEKRLTRARKLAALVPGLTEIDTTYAAALAVREKGLIAAETAPQAQAQLLQIVRKAAQLQSPPIELRGSEFAPIRPYGNAYGEVSVTIAADCGVEQIVNFLADLSRQPELISTSALSFGQAHPKKKTVPMRLTVTGLVARKLVPEKRAEGTF